MTPMLELKSVGLEYGQKKVINNISFKINQDQIVALIGKSGSGKSTILRIMAKIIEPSYGQIEYYTGFGYDKISMVFQNFALFPWLTVEENIATVLQARKIPTQQITYKTDSIIELIGLTGYNKAYPKELSGGMKQRVGIARALVTQPELIIMDEPFSALDVLTANTLKDDLIDIWRDNKIPLKSILFVTHNIEEAVMLADRVIILASNPGVIVSEIDINLERPRSSKDQYLSKYVDQVYSYFLSESHVGSKVAKTADIYYQVPVFFSVRGLLECIDAQFGQIALNQLDGKYALNASEIIEAAGFLELLKFVAINGNIIILTQAGKMLIESDTKSRKQIFAQHLMRHLPIIGYIVDILKNRFDHKVPKKRFLMVLQDRLAKKDAIQVLTAVTYWARYAGLFSYDDQTKFYYL